MWPYRTAQELAVILLRLFCLLLHWYLPGWGEQLHLQSIENLLGHRCSAQRTLFAIIVECICVKQFYGLRRLFSDLNLSAIRIRTISTAVCVRTFNDGFILLELLHSVLVKIRPSSFNFILELEQHAFVSSYLPPNLCFCRFVIPFHFFNKLLFLLLESVICSFFAVVRLNFTNRD